MNILGSYSEAREVRITTEEGQARKSTLRGCPQGSVLGPLLWNIYIDGLLELLHQEEKVYDQAAYADDVIILIQGPSRARLEEKGNDVMATVADWTRQMGLEIAPHKSQVIKFGAPLKRLPVIRCDGNTIPAVHETPYLGVQLDDKLSYDKHIKGSLARAESAMQKVLTISKRYQIPPQAAWRYCTCIFLTIASYGCTAFAKAYERVAMKNAAGVYQRRVLRRMTRAYSTTPVDSLQVVCNIPPLDLEIRARAMKMERSYGTTVLGKEDYTEADIDQWKIMESATEMGQLQQGTKPSRNH